MPTMVGHDPKRCCDIEYKCKCGEHFKCFTNMTGNRYLPECFDSEALSELKLAEQEAINDTFITIIEEFDDGTIQINPKDLTKLTESYAQGWNEGQQHYTSDLREQIEGKACDKTNSDGENNGNEFVDGYNTALRNILDLLEVNSLDK